MNKYELALVFVPTLDEEGYKAQFEKIQALITRFNGTIDKIDEWGKRRLQYEILKQNEGIYAFVTFTADPTVPAELERRIRIMEQVLRYLIVKLEA